jgi:hypothetical protein
LAAKSFDVKRFHSFVKMMSACRLSAHVFLYTSLANNRAFIPYKSISTPGLKVDNHFISGADDLRGFYFFAFSGLGLPGRLSYRKCGKTEWKNYI